MRVALVLSRRVHHTLSATGWKPVPRGREATGWKPVPRWPFGNSAVLWKEDNDHPQNHSEIA